MKNVSKINNIKKREKRDQNKKKRKTRFYIYGYYAPRTVWGH